MKKFVKGVGLALGIIVFLVGCSNNNTKEEFGDIKSTNEENELSQEYSVDDAIQALYSRTGESTNEVVYVYSPDNNYVQENYIKNENYVFQIHYLYNGEVNYIADFNYIVNKVDLSIHKYFPSGDMSIY